MKTITISKILVRLAVEEAGAEAARREIAKQTNDQLSYDANINVTGANLDIRIDWPNIPDSTGLHFEWTD